MSVSRPNWKALLLICLAVFTAFVAVFAIPPLIPELVRRLQISYTRAGLLMTAFTVVPAAGSLVIGFLSDRVGARRSIVTGLAIIAVAGYFSALCSSFAQMLACRVLIGIGATSIFVPGLAAVLYVLPPERVNLATGTFFSSLNLGLSFALLVTPLIEARFGGRFPLQVYAGLAVVVTLLFLFLSADGSVAAARVRRVPPARATGEHRGTSLALVCIGNLLLFYQSFGMITWLPDYLREIRGFTPAAVGLLSMLLGLIIIPGSLFAGWAADRMGGKWVAASGATLCALGPALMIAAPQLPQAGLAADIFFVSLGTALLTIPLTSIITELVSERDSGKAVGAILTTGYSGAIISTAVGGYLRTLTTGYTWIFGSCAFSMVLTLMLLPFLRPARSAARAVRAA